jgi:hypothetical protein
MDVYLLMKEVVKNSNPVHEEEENVLGQEEIVP